MFTTYLNYQFKKPLFWNFFFMWQDMDKRMNYFSILSPCMNFVTKWYLYNETVKQMRFSTEIFFVWKERMQYHKHNSLTPPPFSHHVKEKLLWIFHEVDIQTRISPQDNDHNKKHKNPKFNKKYNKKPSSSQILRLEFAFSCIVRLKVNNHSFQITT